MESKLKLNRENGMMEMVLTISIDRKAHLRRLMAYIEENNIDYTDLAQYQKALDKVSSLYEWQNHPDARVLFTEQPKQIEQPKKEKDNLREKGRSYYFDDSPKLDEDAFIRKLIETPEKDWETIRTQIPEGYHQKYGTHGRLYYNREREKKIMAWFRQGKYDNLLPVSIEKLQVVAEATNGARHK